MTLAIEYPPNDHFSSMMRELMSELCIAPVQLGVMLSARFTSSVSEVTVRRGIEGKPIQKWDELLSAVTEIAPNVPGEEWLWPAHQELKVAHNAEHVLTTSTERYSEGLITCPRYWKGAQIWRKMTDKEILSELRLRGWWIGHRALKYWHSREHIPFGIQVLPLLADILQVPIRPSLPKDCLGLSRT